MFYMVTQLLMRTTILYITYYVLHTIIRSNNSEQHKDRGGNQSYDTVTYSSVYIRIHIMIENLPG